MPCPSPIARRHFVWLLSPLAVLAMNSSAAETVTVNLADGRVVTGVVDGQTDSSRLWLRREEAGFELSSGFAWDQVTQGQLDGRIMNRAQFRDWTEVNKQSGRKFLELIPVPRFDERGCGRSSTASPPPSGGLPGELPVLDRGQPAVVGTIRALIIEASPAQWDGDVQPDGLRIFVAPVDARGDLVPVDGQIEFTLVVENEKLNGGKSGSLRPEFRELARGSAIVRREHFSLGPAVYELAFSQRHPDFDSQIAAQALVHARLGVPGRGVFEASDSQVLLRECSRFRDQLQYYSRSRFLPLESGGQPNR